MSITFRPELTKEDRVQIALGTKRMFEVAIHYSHFPSTGRYTTVTTKQYFKWCVVHLPATSSIRAIECAGEQMKDEIDKIGIRGCDIIFWSEGISHAMHPLPNHCKSSAF